MVGTIFLNLLSDYEEVHHKKNYHVLLVYFYISKKHKRKCENILSLTEIIHFKFIVYQARNSENYVSLKLIR